MINRKLALFLAFIMLLGLVPTNVFAANTAKLEPANDKAYEEVIIDGAPYKVYKVADFIDGHSEESTISLMSRSAKPFGSPAPTGTDDIKFVLDLAWETIDRPINNVIMPVYVGDLSDSRSIKLGHFIVNSAASPGAKQRIEMVQEYFGPTPSIENLVKKAFAKIKIAIPEDMKYDFILASTKWEDTQKEGTTGIDLKVVFKIEGTQSVMHGFGIKWYDTDAANREKIDAKWGGLVGQELDAKLATVDRNYSAYFANKIDRTNPGRLQHYPDGSEYTPFDYYYNGEKITTCADAENQGKFDNNQLAIGPNSDRSNAKLTVDGKRHGEKVLKNNTKYFYDSVGDYRTFHVLSMREALEVKFNTGKGSLTDGGKANQEIGKAQEIGHSETIANNESGRTINVPTIKLVPPAAKAGKPANEFIGWALTADATTALFKTQDEANAYATPFTDKTTTFYAIYAPKAQGKIRVEYQDMQGQPIDAKYKLEGKEYPTELPGNNGEAIKAEHLNGAPEFLGYEYKANATKPVPSPGETAGYTENGEYTLIYKYNKLDSVIPEKDPNGGADKTKPNGYVTVTFKVGDHGKINGGTDDIKYFVNPKDNIKFGNTAIAEPTITANNNYKVKDPKWSPDFNDAKKAETITADAEFTAQYEKEKGTVKYEYKYENKTSINNPSKTDIPAVPTDDTKYDVETKVNAEATVAKDKTVPVKDNGTTIGSWKFSGWTPASLTIAKGENKFTGTWTFTEAGKQQVTYEFASGTNGETLPTEVTNLLTKQAESKYVNDTVIAPTDTYNAVEISTGSKQGTWTFDGWYAGTTDANKKGQALTVTEAGPNKFIGVWKFAEKGKKNVNFEFAFYNNKGNKPIPNNAIGQFKPTLPPAQNNKYVGSDITLPTFQDVPVKTGDLQGTWKFDGWYRGDTKLTAANAKVSATDAENKLVGKWILTEAETKEVTRVFVIDKAIMGDGKDVPTGHALPQGVKDQKPNDTTNYIGSKQTPGKDKFTAVPETINGKQGTWTFVKWDKNELTVSETETDNVFTGTWTWNEKLVVPTDPSDPKTGKDQVLVKFLKGEHGTLTGIVLDQHGNEVPVSGKDVLAYNVKNTATWGAMEEYIPRIVADSGWRVANPSWKPVLPATDKVVEAATFTAQYVAKPIDEYITLTLDENYRGGRISDYDAYQGALIEGYLYRPHRRGYVFEGWSYNSRRLDEVRPGDRIEYSTILYAIWSKQKPKDDEEVEPIDTREVGEHKAYMFGYTDGTVRPNGYITRAEAAALVTRLLGLDTFASAAEPAFTDTPSSWYNKAINAAVARGIMKGYPDKSFRPNAPITRAEFTQMISTIDNKPYGVAPFADVVGHWAERPIGSEYQAGRIKGYPDGTFRPNAFITRAEAVVILNKIFERNYDAMSAINAKNKEYIKRFIDLTPSFWGFNDMVEATNTHLFKRRVKGAIQEDWVEVK